MGRTYRSDGENKKYRILVEGLLDSGYLED